MNWEPRETRVATVRRLVVVAAVKPLEAWCSWQEKRLVWMSTNYVQLECHKLELAQWQSVRVDARRRWNLRRGLVKRNGCS